MLDMEIQEQLKGLFSQLQSKIELVCFPSQHSDFSELQTLLKDVADASPKVSLEMIEGGLVATPYFKIKRQGVETGISFRGIPGGHEFSSLVLAILNSDSKGKLPDTSIQSRIKKLKGPIRLRTYVSLSCENCPDVVQMLNQMALIHDDFEHEMVDGVYAQDEVESLGIQGVPSVVSESLMIHSGRIQLLDLLDLLEKKFGTDASSQSLTESDLGHFDVVVIGGGPAGVSAAVYSARKGLKTAIIAEKVGGQVNETKGIENLIGTRYTEGPLLASQLREHLAAYPVQVFENRRVQKIHPSEKKKIEMEGGEVVTASATIIATGAKWRELGVPGEKDYLGRGVAYCPHCDGPFYKGKKVAVVGGGNSGVEAAIDLAGIVREVVLMEFQDHLKADQVLLNKLYSLSNVSIVLGSQCQTIVGDGHKVSAIEYQDRKTRQKIQLDLDGIFIQIGLVPNTRFLKDTLELTSFGEIVVDHKGRTSLASVYAAGDVTTTPYKQISIAMGEGAKTALAAFEDRMRLGS